MVNFRIGEQVVQKINGVEIFRATVVDWRFGSNLLKVANSTGIVREDVSIESTIMPVSGMVQSIFVTTFSEEISSFYDNLGYYQSDKGKLGVQNQKIIDSLFYQDYSYVIKSGTSIEQWRDLIKATTHPAGFKLFGQVDIEATANFATRDQGSLVELPKDRILMQHTLLLYNFGILRRIRLQLRTQVELLHRVYKKLRTKEYVKDLVLLQQVNLILTKQKHLSLH